jgi:hypothetical protein
MIPFSTELVSIADANTSTIIVERFQDDYGKWDIVSGFQDVLWAGGKRVWEIG